MRRPVNTMQLTSRKGAVDSELGVLISNNASLDSNDDTPTHQNKSSQDANSKLSRKYAFSNSSPLMIALRRLKYQWVLMSLGSRIAVCTVALFFFQYVVLGTIDVMFHQMGDPAMSTSKQGGPVESTFAVAINTFRRPEMLRDAVQHYAETCGKRAGVSQVFVIWAEQGVPLPEPSSFFTPSSIRSDSQKTSNRADVYVLQKDKDSLNSRFEPIEQLDSTAVFMVDDDLRVACPSLTTGFHAYNAHPDSMAGYYPRLASPPRDNPDSASDLVYHTWPIVFLEHKFNFVLTKAAFLHSKYLAMYSSKDFPQEIKDHVDQHKNCEDIAMSMLIANYTKLQTGSPADPIFVEGAVSDKGLFGGISTGGGHMSTRSDCLTVLTAIMKNKGWGAPLSYEVPLGDHSWLRHAPGFWWQFRPSNFFEWFSFGNMFT
jgi:hypothetical protein